jgi:DNA/RNA-binding domain of Phe-tRNA-synthetase-like protein
VHPDAVLGVLAMRNLRNPASSPELSSAKERLERALRERFAGLSRAELRATPVLDAYARYYRGFGNTYHVQLQLESIVHKGRSIPNVAALVETMFMAELQNQLLTAVHDLATLAPPLRFDVAGDDPPGYVMANGRETTLKPGDIYMTDAVDVICSIIYGQDQRTRVTPHTTEALFVVYAPPGVDPALVATHLNNIVAYVRLVAPGAAVDLSELYTQAMARQPGQDLGAAFRNEPPDRRPN